MGGIVTSMPYIYVWRFQVVVVAYVKTRPTSHKPTFNVLCVF